MGRRMLVWMVAVAAGVEAVAESVIAARDGDYGRGAIWVAAAVIVATFAVAIERVKLFLEE